MGNDGLKLDDTLDTVVRVLSDRDDLSLAQLRDIAARVREIDDPESKCVRIDEIARDIPRPESSMEAEPLVAPKVTVQ